MINSEYPSSDSPSKNVGDLSAGPKYDVTPLQVLNHNCGDLSTGPVYDHTPYKKDISDGNKEAVPDSVSGDCTPVWQDTQSQSVDGTEEVTQEHNVQAQLAKYYKEHADRVSAHNEKLNKYYRKHPSKLKSGKDVLSDFTNSHIEKAVAEDPVVTKVRNAVAKRKASGSPTVQYDGGTPRRSPRVASSSQQPAPKVSTPASKLRRGVDKAYVSEAGDAAARPKINVKVSSLFFFCFIYGCFM